MILTFSPYSLTFLLNSNITTVPQIVWQPCAFSRPYLRCPPSLHTIKDCWDKSDVSRGLSGGKQAPIQEIKVKFEELFIGLPVTPNE